MITIDMEGLSDDELALATQCTVGGVLRASKPKDPRAAYVWRMVGYLCASTDRLRCRPNSVGSGSKELDDLVRKLVRRSA